MIDDLRLILRLAILGSVLAILQVAAVSQVLVLGVSADLTPLVVVSVGLLCGSVPGALMGFFMGLWVDTALLQTLGVSSLAYLTVGYLAGRLRELRDPDGTLVPLVVGAAGTAIAGLAFGLMQFLLGVDSPVSLLLLRQVFAVIVVNAIIALPVYALVRRALEPVLPDDPRRRRRRAYTTGGLSPLTRA